MGDFSLLVAPRLHVLSSSARDLFSIYVKLYHPEAYTEHYPNI